ncbi:hypothetical protein TRFO_01676 [Tritrichomonas foetus]|uniref:Lecithin:cholesterol acyltransferase family protein n=1 Tax=Tritrichomonas foetus TaxID=1144522 RepID=A0A1J4JPY0_9EUKA|nr:hypothetical protein TRFO_01676 [Tritrichomonas foetus]|eukprot:OHT01099.1 hypothetical protein TRFO_01676 [Tritrichomonas foetus]
MFSFFIFSCLSVKPVILIPGHGGSGAWATITRPELYPECPAFLSEKFHFWPMNATFAEAYPECMGYLIRAVFNETTQQITHPEGIIFEQEPWGEMETLYNYVDLVKYFIDRGYTKGKNLWGIAYDWVLYYPGTESLFDKLADFIEKVHKDSKQKVVVMGHSMGTHVLRMLLTQRRSEKWVEEHIDGAAFLAPAFYGCFVSFNMVVQGKFGAIPVNEVAAKSARQMPSLHVLWDNYHVFDNHSVFQNVLNMSDGVKPDEVKDYLVSVGRFDEDAQKIFKYVEPSLQERPVEPNVRSLVLFNGGISTPIALDVSKNYAFINQTGDAICHDGGPKYACANWKNVQCHDWKRDDWLYSHSQMMYRNDTLEIIYKWVGNEEEEGEVDTYNYTPLIIGCVVGGVVIIAATCLILFFISRKDSQRNGFNKQ